MALEGCYPMEEHDSRLLMGDPAALAYAWMLAYAKNLNDQCQGDPDDPDDCDGTVTIEDLLNTADSHQPDQNKNG